MPEKKNIMVLNVLLRPENFTDENSVRHKKKQLSLKCAIKNVFLAVSDKVPTLISDCIEASLSLWEGLN